MRTGIIVLTCLSLTAAAGAQRLAGPTNPKAQKTFANAQDWAKGEQFAPALDAFRKADKQDGGHCSLCEAKVVEMGLEGGDFKSAEAAANVLIAEANTPPMVAYGHMEMGFVHYRQGLLEKKSDLLVQADREFKASTAAYLLDPEVYYYDGLALAWLHQDSAAKEQFEAYLKTAAPTDVDRTRAQRFIEQPALARANMAPAFSVTTLDGQHVSLDDLKGKVVLIDFWSTENQTCIDALPHIRDLAHEFAGQPLVIISISTDKDSDDAKWKQFVARYHMTWLQVRDGSGEIAKLFGVTKIPHTFAIDADGVLEQEDVGDVELSRKLKQLCARAEQKQETPKEASKAAE